MPFDPSLPAAGAPLQSAVMRDQLNGLKDLIDAVPAGPPGPQGPQGDTGTQGPPFSNAVVDSVMTLPPYNPASVSVYYDGTNVRFTFAIPEGVPGQVSTGDLNAAISSVIYGSSAVSNGVEFLLPTNPNPTVLDVATKLDEVIQALRR